MVMMRARIRLLQLALDTLRDVLWLEGELLYQQGRVELPGAGGVGDGASSRMACLLMRSATAGRMAAGRRKVRARSMWRNLPRARPARSLGCRLRRAPRVARCA